MLCHIGFVDLDLVINEHPLHHEVISKIVTSTSTNNLSYGIQWCQKYSFRFISFCSRNQSTSNHNKNGESLWHHSIHPFIEVWDLLIFLQTIFMRRTFNNFSRRRSNRNLFVLWSHKIVMLQSIEPKIDAATKTIVYLWSHIFSTKNRGRNKNRVYLGYWRHHFLWFVCFYIESDGFPSFLAVSISTVCHPLSRNNVSLWPDKLYIR